MKPKLIIKGGFGSGKCLVNRIPTVLTAGTKYTLVELEYGMLPRISQYVTDRDEIEIKEFVPRSWFLRYAWAKPYPTVSAHQKASMGDDKAAVNDFAIEEKESLLQGLIARGTINQRLLDLLRAIGKKVRPLLSRKD